ncbi:MULTISPECIES: DUF6932 family protein [Emticicia]|uniref:DUF6932 family protein n=1 Tax=Emticicia TaxID=312278 RepID=UPI0007D89BF9|nr:MULTISPECIES: hypothetical protein [Emticicia]
MNLINFDEKGFLKPYEIIHSDLQSLKAIFVDNIEISKTRKPLFDNYLEYLAIIKDVIPNNFHQWIDGSFITQKQNPNDIDIVTFINYQDFERNIKTFDSLRKWRYDKTKGVDGYFVPIFPENHRKNAIFKMEQQEWKFQFGNDRNGNKKGIIELNF